LARLVGLFFDRLMEVGRLLPLERAAHFLLRFPRMLHRLRSDNLISMQRRRIDLLDIEGLRRLSEFAPPAPVAIPDDERLDSNPLITTGLRQASASLLTTSLM
jgi:hypothetical protein